MAAYILTLESGEEYPLKLTALQLQGYLKTNFKGQQMPPLPAVIQAVDNLDCRLDLFQRALTGGNPNCKLRGADLYDRLVEEGWTPEQVAALVVEIADASGLIPKDMRDDLMTAVTTSANGVIGQARRICAAMDNRLDMDAAGEDAPDDPTK